MDPATAASGERPAGGAQPAPGTQPAATTATPQQQLARARADLQQHQAHLQPLEAALAAVDTALQQNTQDRRGLEQHLTTARNNLAAGTRRHTEAQAERDTARTSAQQLDAARTALTQAVTQHTPAIQAHEAAATTAVTHAAAATQVQRALASASAQVMELATQAHPDHQAYQAQVPVTQRAEQALQAAQALLAPTGRLTTEVQRCEQALNAAKAAPASSTTTASGPTGAPGAAGTGTSSSAAGTGTSPGAVGANASAPTATGASSLPSGESASVQRAERALARAQADVQQQEAVVARLEQTAQQATTRLDSLRAAAESSQQALQAAEQNRTGLATQAAEAVRQAQTSAQARDAAAAGATTARDAISGTVTALCDALSPPTPPTGTGASGVAATPPPGTLIGRARDAVQRKTESLGNRMGPLKIDGTLGPFSASSTTNATTGFRDGLPPSKTITTATDARALKSVDAKARTAAVKTAGLLAQGAVGKPGAAATPPAFGNAVAFTAEIHSMFAGGDAATAATPAATRLADALLGHPNPDPTGRPDGHPLRHEQALLVATVLRSVTDDPAVAAHLYNRLWSDPAPQLGGVRRRGAEPSPLAGLSDLSPPHDNAMQSRVNEARRVLAATSSGMDALLHLQGLSLPDKADPHRRHAEQAVEMYKLGLRAETEVMRQLARPSAALRQPITVADPQGSEEILQALQRRPDFATLQTATQLGRGTRSRNDREDPATLSVQAFLYAKDNLLRGVDATGPEARADLKPAYVALRNGFTESGQGSDFHNMARRLNKFVKYIDLACATPVAGPSLLDNVKHPRQAFRRKRGKDKTPLKTLMQAGPLGSHIGTVSGEHATRLRSALDRSKKTLESRLTNPQSPLTAEQRTAGLMRLAAMQLWEAQVPEKPGPLLDLSQGIRLTPEAVLDKARALNQTLFGGNGATPPALHDGTVARENAAHLNAPLLPGTLHDWLAELPAAATPASSATASTAASATAATASTAASATAATTATAATATTASPANTAGAAGTSVTAAGSADGSAAASTPTDPFAELKKDVDILRGKAAIDNTLKALQDEFDKRDVAGRREILRKVMISVVAGGDMTDYSDGRKNGIGGMFGYLAAQVNGVGALTTGITPVAEFNLDHTRTAVLKAGVASNTGVIFLGSETKVTEMVGLGVRVGAQAGIVNMSAQAMARLGGAHLFTKGLMIRTNKQGEEHRDLDASLTQSMKSDNWKRMSELVVNSVFDIAAQPSPTAAGNTAGPTRPQGGGEMWAQMVGKIGDYRDISFGWNTGSSHQATASLGVDGNVGVKAGPVGRFSIAGGLGLRSNFFNRSKARETSGATQTTQANSSSKTSVGAALSGGFSHPAIAKQGQPDVAVFARHKVGVETELILQAQNGAVRITTMDGKVQPGISYKHRECAVEEDFMKMVNSQRGLWEPRLGVRREDGTLSGGKEALDGFLQQVAHLPPGNSRMFIERKSLKPEAADTITACLHRLDALERQPGDTAAKRDQMQGLRQQIAAQVADEDSWQPFRLFVNQSQQRSRDNGFGGEHRASGATPADKDAGPTGFAERFLGGGRVTLGGKVNTAHGGRDLITIDAMPERV
ncbi:hypothetical protein CDN98_01070 [Roseateles terrae]|nr:hypothetical protein CDN98_01070 [Roseateles terrae]